MEFCKRYSSEVPCTEDYQGEKVEGSFANLRRRTSISDQRYEQFVQLCTDKECFARDSVTSKRSSASSIARKHELIALQLKQMELSLELERAQAEAERKRADAEFRRRKIEVELKQARAVARMKLLKLKEAMSASARTKSKRKEQLQRREVATKNSESEPCCCKNVSKDYLSWPLRNIVSSREANTASCVYSRSSAITIDRQPVTSKVDVVDKKTNLNVGGRDSIPKLRVLSNQDEALPPSRPNVSAQGLPLGPVPLDDVSVNAQGLALGPWPLDNVSTNIGQSNARAMEKIKGLRTAICDRITLPKRNLPAFDDFIAMGPLTKAEECMDKPATDMAKCHITLVQRGYESELNELNSSQTLLYVFKRLPVNLQTKFDEKVAVKLIGYAPTFVQLLSYVDAAERAHWLFGVT